MAVTIRQEEQKRLVKRKGWKPNGRDAREVHHGRIGKMHPSPEAHHSAACPTLIRVFRRRLLDTELMARSPESEFGEPDPPRICHVPFPMTRTQSMKRGGTFQSEVCYLATNTTWKMERNMGRGILLWLLGIPLPIVILLVLFLR